MLPYSFIPSHSYPYIHPSILPSHTCTKHLLRGWCSDEQGVWFLPEGSQSMDTHTRLQHGVVTIVIHLSPSFQGSPEEEMGASRGAFQGQIALS